MIFGDLIDQIIYKLIPSLGQKKVKCFVKSNYKMFLWQNANRLEGT